MGSSHRIAGIFSMQVSRGEFICPKKGCLTLNVLIVANPLQCLLILQKANQFTAKHVSRNTELIKENCLTWTQGLTWKMHGQVRALSSLLCVFIFLFRELVGENRSQLEMVWVWDRNHDKFALYMTCVVFNSAVQRRCLAKNNKEQSCLRFGLTTQWKNGLSPKTWLNA